MRYGVVWLLLVLGVWWSGAQAQPPGAGLDLYNLELTTPLVQPPVTTLRVKAVVIDLVTASLRFEYVYGTLNGTDFVESPGGGSLLFQGSEIEAVMTRFTQQMAPLLKTLLAGRLGRPVN